MKILLIEDHKMLATCLKESIEKDTSIKIDILDDIRNIFILIKFLEYDLIIIDINLTGLTKEENGIDLSKRLLDEFNDLKIVILTGYNLKYYQERAKRIGCYGFISKEEETKSLINKLYKIVNNNEKIFPLIRQKSSSLSKDEIEIIKLYSSGMTREEVANERHVSLRTLAVELNRIYLKLEVKNYQQMTDTARKLGYIDSF